ncbi:MAG TPA: NB-ARC domain-containing protein [Gaiellaceae bacterium]
MAANLPTGTVTFLFTDVEASTRLLRDLGEERYAVALAEHRRVVRAAFDRHGGVEVDTQGDAFFAGFPTAGGALVAAREITAALEGGPIRVRVGVHTGTPLLADGGYIGVDVHRAARIAAAGHGGQVLVSASTAALFDGSGLHDLGDHRFKDLAAPERVFQLGDGDFPPLRTLYRTNLPVPATSFLGRDEEVAETAQVLRRPEVRLLTLTGPGGTGKTRLALQAAAEAGDEFPDGVWWVPLAALAQAELVAVAVAQALEVTEEAGRSLEDTVSAHLAGKRSLVLLDNAEHLLPGAALSVAGLIQVEGPTVLVTSRERLRVQAEHVFAVPSLSAHDGTALFVARARQAETGFTESPAVEELCRRLDDLPLALELAAARTAMFSAEQLLERLGQRLDLLTGSRDSDPRQATLRATIRWSFDLLEPAEQRLFARLAVFDGGCTYEAAESVCDAEVETLESLIDKSLVRRREGSRRPRYWMLETIRQFGGELLDSSDDDELRRRHAEFFTAFAELADPHLRHGPDQEGWGDRVAEDYGNVRAAMQFALEHAPELALRLVGSLTFFVWLRGGFAEARAWVDAALAAAPDASPSLIGRAHECGAVIAERLADPAAARAHAEAAHSASSAAGDERGLANALRELGKAYAALGEGERVKAIYEELAELSDRIGDEWNGAIALNNLGDRALYDGDWARAVELCGRSSEIRQRLGDRWGSALALTNVAVAELQLGRIDDAARSVRTALVDSLAVRGLMVVVASLDTCAMIASRLGRAAESALILGASDRLHEELGSGRETFELELVEVTTLCVRESLGEEAFADEFERGRLMTIEEATEHALSAVRS